MKYIIILLTFFNLLPINAQEFPQNYFTVPLKIPLALSGTFGELRSNHFHSGLDIRTQGKEGFDIHSSAKGYISRIKITHYGYGKAIYIQHPNGYTTVYAHLKKFAPKIEAYVKQRQYQQEKYTIELFPGKNDLVVTQDEIIAYSGNSGGSGGPHLHFEIRDSSQRPMNPLLFGIEIKDTRKPIVNSAWLYPLNEKALINGSNKPYRLKLVVLKDGSLRANKVNAIGKVGIAVSAVDQQNPSNNKNGYYKIETKVNGSTGFEIILNRFSFAETRYLNRLIDYKYFKNNRSRITKLFREPNNPLSIIRKENGFINVKDSLTYNCMVNITDVKQNLQSIIIPITGKNVTTHHEEVTQTSQFYANPDSSFEYSNTFMSLSIPKKAFYEPIALEIEELPNQRVKIHKNTTPLHKYMTLNFPLANLPNPKRSYIGRFFKNEPDKPSFVGSKNNGTTLSARTRDFGNFGVFVDEVKPKVTPINFSNNKWISSNKTLRVTISDFESGIKNYKATINGKFALMEYDYKRDLLVYNFTDGISSEGKNDFRLYVEDNVGNNTIFEATFFRK